MAAKTLGELIQEARGERFKLRELARLLEISPTHLSDIENNRRAPSEELLVQLAKHLEIDVDKLLALDGRVSGETRRYIEKVPEAVSLFRKVSAHRLQPKELKEVEKTVERLAEKRKRP
jgi:transcriptional regulator with XRE-family HTH domain